MRNKLLLLAVAALAVLACTPEYRPVLYPKHDPDITPVPTPEPSPVPTPVPISKGAYKHVVILGVDGGGAFFSPSTTPKTHGIFSLGATSSTVKTSYPTISAQCWGSMLHGVLPEFHRLTNDIVAKRPYDPESAFPSIFRIVREAMPEAELASFCNWNPINYGIIEDNVGVYEGTGNDQTVTDLVLNYLSGNNPAVLFVQFDSVDGAGHGSGYGSENHLKALSGVDEMIGRIFDALSKKISFGQTLFIVSADHGGTPGGSHGGDTPAERNVFLGVRGSTVAAGSVILDAEVQDIPAIAAYALGIDIPDTWTARVPSGVFPGVEATERRTPVIPVNENRKHKTEPTPDPSLMRELLKGHKVMAYFPFDGDVNDAFGLTETVQNGKLYYYDAYFGSGVSMVDGHVTLKNVSPGNSSFSVALWMKADEISDDPCILSNKNWTNGGNDGFVLSLRPDDIKFNAGWKEAGERIDDTFPLPFDYKAGWMHVALVVDRQKGRCRLYYDFKPDVEYEMPDGWRDVSFDALDLNIGQDGTGGYPYRLPAQLDEMIVTADVLDDADIAALKQYYK